MNWDVIIKWLPKLAEGAQLTLELVAIAVLAGLLIAIPLGMARASRHWYVRILPFSYIFFFRGTPLLLQLFLVYYGLAQFDVIVEPIMAVPARSLLVRINRHDHAHRSLYCGNHSRCHSGCATGGD